MSGTAPPGRLAVAILFLAALTSVVSGTLLSPLLPAIAADLDVSVAAAGQLGTAASVVSLIVALAALPWMNRIPRPVWLRGQCFVLAVAAILCALAPSFVWLAAGRMLAGLGGAIVLANCLSAAGDYFPDPARRNRAVGVIVSAAALGIVAGLPIIAQIEEFAGWRWAIASPLLLLALVFGATWLLPTETAGRSVTAADGAVSCYRHVLGRASTRWLLTTMGIILLGYIGWLTFFGAYVVEYLDAGAGTLSALFLVAGTVQLVTNNLTPAALGRWSSARLFQIALGTFVVALLALGTGIRELWVVFVAVTAINVAGAVAYIVVNSLLLQASATMRGSVMALSSAATSFGGIVGVTLGGAALAAFDYAAVYRLLGAVLPIALVTFALSARRPAPKLALAEEPMAVAEA